MAFLSVEDMYGAIEVIVFPRIFTENAVKLQEGNVILLSGRLSLREDEDPKVICDLVEAVPDPRHVPAGFQQKQRKKRFPRQFQPHSLCGLRPAKPRQSGGGFSCALPLRMRLSGCERSGCCAFLMVRRRCITIIVIRKRMKRGRRRSLSILTSRCSESCGGF